MLSTTSSISASSITSGPSGRAIAEAIDSDLLSAIQAHLNMERQAHASYFAAAIWFAERELRGFSRFFRDASNSEHVHAAKFAEYIIAREQWCIPRILQHAHARCWMRLGRIGKIPSTLVQQTRLLQRNRRHGLASPCWGGLGSRLEDQSQLLLQSHDLMVR